jgi:hypothetical protein
MSRGLGKWERKILSELAIRDHFALNELVGPERTRSRAKYNALYRAMRKLETSGQVIVWRFLFSRDRTWVCRHGIKPTGEDRDRLRKSKGW